MSVSYGGGAELRKQDHSVFKLSNEQIRCALSLEGHPLCIMGCYIVYLDLVQGPAAGS